MTVKKAVPGRRGRKRRSDGFRRVIWIRYEKFEKGALERDPDRTAPDIKNEFIGRYQSWLRTIGIKPGDDRALSNILTVGRKSAALRKWNWRTSRNPNGKGKIEPIGAYLRHHEMQALGLTPFKVEPLGLAGIKMKNPILE